MHVLCIGAHPDDCESAIGGTAALFRRRGDVVRFLSLTNGDKGHFASEYRADPTRLAARRNEEAVRAASVIGCEYRCLGWHDGCVYVDQHSTETVVRAIRGFGPIGRGPDLILTNRPCDYHRDHRYTAQLVLDALYMLTVPLACPDTPHLTRLPVVAYWNDDFTESGAFKPDVLVPTEETIHLKTEMVLAHESQFLEWIPYNAGSHEAFAGFPSDKAEQAERIRSLYARRAEQVALRYADLLPGSAWLAEAFQVSDYGRQPEPEELRRLFPLPTALA